MVFLRCTNSIAIWKKIWAHVVPRVRIGPLQSLLVMQTVMRTCHERWLKGTNRSHLYKQFTFISTCFYSCSPFKLSNVFSALWPILSQCASKTHWQTDKNLLIWHHWFQRWLPVHTNQSSAPHIWSLRHPAWSVNRGGLYILPSWGKEICRSCHIWDQRSVQTGCGNQGTGHGNEGL